MPIGKNAIKRVENNGYSKVKTAAPDMENSHVIAKPDPQVEEKLIAPVEKATAKKAACKTTVKKAPATKKPAAKKPTVKTVKTAKTEKDPFAYVNVGAEMPYYLI